MSFLQTTFFYLSDDKNYKIYSLDNHALRFEGCSEQCAIALYEYVRDKKITRLFDFFFIHNEKYIVASPQFIPELHLEVVEIFNKIGELAMFL